MSGRAPSRSVLSIVVVRQPRQGLAPPGRVARASRRAGRTPGSPSRSPAPGARPPRPGACGRPAPGAGGRSRRARGIASRIARQAALGGSGENRSVYVGGGKMPRQAMDLQGGEAQGDEHRGRRDEAVDPVGPAPAAGERPGQVADDEPGQERDRGPSPPPSSRRTPGPASTPTATRQRRAWGSCSPFQKARAVAAQRNSPGMSVAAMWPSP